ncbi:POK18 protein, partial [Urocolius indicus]|nr:POK18 protein [Urocolius indicus]
SHFLGAINSQTKITAQEVKLQTEVKTLHDVQKLVGSLQWLRGVVSIPNEWMTPFYNLLKGQAAWES